VRTDNTRNARAKRVREKKLAAGMASRTVYLPLSTLESLRQVFQGPAGGIAWEAVAAAALELRRRQLRDAEGQKQRRALGLVNDTTAPVRARRYRAKAKTEGRIIDPTGNERAKRYREAHRAELAQRERERRAAKKKLAESAEQCA
jgi:hypothetical protein